MRLLLIGGTSFVGRAIALAGIAAGHEVTILNRGRTPSDLPEVVERLTGDRRSDLSALHARTFDATVDVIAYRPSDVAALHEALGDRGGHHLQISSISAYQDPPDEGATEETAVLLPDGTADPEAPISAETYGPLKAASEREAVARFGSQTTIIRPTFVIGGHDASLRFPYWVERCRRGGTVAVPGPRNIALQYVDARDLGAFTVALVGSATSGAFTAAGPWPAARFVDVVEQIARHVAPRGTTVVEIPPEVVDEHDLASKFPLWSGPVSETMLSMDPSKALAHGLCLRPLEESIDDVVSWWADRQWPEHWLTDEEQQALVRSV